MANGIVWKGKKQNFFSKHFRCVIVVGKNGTVVSNRVAQTLLGNKTIKFPGNTQCWAAVLVKVGELGPPWARLVNTRALYSGGGGGGPLQALRQYWWIYILQWLSWCSVVISSPMIPNIYSMVLTLVQVLRLSANICQYTIYIGSFGASLPLFRE